jgi:hypothetical protein
MRLTRLAVLLVPVLLGLLAMAHPGWAQAPATRYAFADTTLLRDTLGIKFDALFPLADSLRVTPDTLRALAVRYAAPLWRIVRLADSLAVTPDSISAVLERERFNPLAASSRYVNQFGYRTTYDIQRTAGTWNNDAQWNYVAHGLVLNNNTIITLIRNSAVNGTSLQQTRQSTTEAGWRFSPDVSLGSRVRLYRFDTHYPTGGLGETETTNEIAAPLRLRAKPSKSLSAELNLLPGFLDTQGTRVIKRGTSGDLNGKLRYVRGNTLTHEITTQLSGNMARTRPPLVDTTLHTRDYARNVSGLLTMFNTSPVGLNANYRFRRSVVESPLEASGSVQKLLNENNGVDLTLRGRLDADRTVNVTANYGRSRTMQNSTTNSFSTRRDLGMGVDGRYTLFGVLFEGQFRNALTRSEYPLRGANGGYGESLHVRSVQLSGSRTLGGRLTLKARGSVDLSSSRIYIIGVYPTPPVDRDAYRQNYRLEASYVGSEKFNTRTALDVSRTLSINIPAASVTSNSEGRTYSAEWNWNYRLLPGLTAVQTNTVTADYLFYTFKPRNNRLGMLYRTTTTMTATLSPRFGFDLSHNTVYQPAGNYVMQPDGFDALTLADKNQNYALRASFSYRPTPAFILSFDPTYYASDRGSTTNGVLQTTRKDRSFDFSGRANINIPVGKRGRLTGNIARSTNSTLATTYSRGIPRAVPGTTLDYWNGSLQLSWDM